jgi:glucosyl-dolichyl phosphate glucuronosyltransferase
MAFTEFQTTEAPVAGAAKAGVRLSVVVATHDRLPFLKNCLDALAAQARRPDVEVIVVDSCSPDHVAADVKREAERHGFAAVRLDEPGVSLARNVGAAQASGRWFATLDDDAIPEPGWVEGALAAIAEASEDAAIIQGCVKPLWEGDGPEAVEPRHARFLSIVMHDHDHEMAAPFHCAGANMLVRRDIHAAIGGYGLRFGRVGTKLISGIDTDLVDRTRAAGGRIFYSNRFPVRHYVPPIRLTRRWVRDRSLHDGRAQGEIVFTRRSRARQAYTVAKSLTALAAMDMLSRLRPDSMDLQIRKCVNIGTLERAPLIGPVMKHVAAHVVRAD